MAATEALQKQVRLLKNPTSSWPWRRLSDSLRSWFWTGSRAMMGRQIEQGALFYTFRLEDRVPANHLLRRIDAILDLGFVHEAMAEHYSANGRPSIDPVLMVRMLLVSCKA